MDFLKSAVASAISKAPPFPYTFGDKVDAGQSIWTLNNGTRREDGSNCSIFSFDVTANRARLPLARNALKKLRTLRHPGVIKVLDTVETDTYIYIATERLIPLRWNVKRKSLSPETIKWGLFSIANTVKFINADANSIHGCLKVDSVYTTESGEWKLGGFEVLSSIKDDDAIIYNYGSLVPDANRYAPPELAREGWSAIKSGPHTAVDSFGFGTLIFEVFNGDFSGPSQAGQTQGIPVAMHASYKRLVHATPKARITVSVFLDHGRRSSSFFDSPLIKLSEGVENLGVKSPDERDQFLSDLEELTDDFPEDFFRLKVVPELLKSVEFGGGGPKALGIVLKISTKFSNDDFDSKMTPAIVRLFANPDRAIRVCLLEGLPQMIDRLSQKIVNDKIFPHLVTGFTDLAPIVREQTLKSVLTIISKLSDRTINGELLKHLAKTANDEQPGIRTNTTICLGKIAKNLGTSSRSKVLIAAFSRSLRDPFVHARSAALMALSATSEYFSDEDCATRIIPAISPLLIDKEKLVRDQASKCLDVFLQKLRKSTASMPDSVLPPPAAETPAVTRMSSPQPNDPSASSWTGWAISSFAKVATTAGDMQPAANGSRAVSPRPMPSPRLPSRGLAASPGLSSQRESVKSTPPLSRASSSTTPTVQENPFPEPDEAPQEGAADSWDNMGDDFFGMAEDTSQKTASKNTATSIAMGQSDSAEPDFASWLAAQSQKKGGAGKTLPKGLTKTTSSVPATKKPVATRKIATRPLAAKKAEPKPTPPAAEKDDEWGDGW